VTVNTQPQHAEIYNGDEFLGAAPGPFRLARSERQLRLVAKAPGFNPATIPITPSTDQEVKVTLVARAARATDVSARGHDQERVQNKRGVSRDLENPY
jgi:hypothetical protein